MIELIDKLRQAYPAFQFVASDTFRWQPHSKRIDYDQDQVTNSPESLLHELGHALLDHDSYHNDVDLLYKERDAWNMARKLAREYAITINKDHVEDCLDTYRDWLFRRSTCPSCALQGIQKASNEYTCLNCHHVWIVTRARFCRPYRRSESKIRAA